VAAGPAAGRPLDVRASRRIDIHLLLPDRRVEVTEERRTTLTIAADER
jgi:hypothetical protein